MGDRTYNTMVEILELLAEYLPHPYYEKVTELIGLLIDSQSYAEQLILLGQIKGILETASLAPSKKR